MADYYSLVPSFPSKGAPLAAKVLALLPVLRAGLGFDSHQVCKPFLFHLIEFSVVLVLPGIQTARFSRPR